MYTGRPPYATDGWGYLGPLPEGGKGPLTILGVSGW